MIAVLGLLKDDEPNVVNIAGLCSLTYKLSQHEKMLDTIILILKGTVFIPFTTSKLALKSVIEEASLIPGVPNKRMVYTPP